MYFTCGHTRFVILTKNYAIKIARFRPIRPFIKLVESLRKKEIKNNLKKHHSNYLLAVVKYFLAGIVANRLECRIYKKCRNDLFVPTLFTFFWLINVQRRGGVVKGNESEYYRFCGFFEGDKSFVVSDILQPKQLCMINGQVCIADYGMDGFDQLIIDYKL